MNKTILIILALLLVAGIAGLTGGLIGNLLVAKFEIDGKDKFDIFGGLLAGVLAVMGLAFGAGWVGISSWLRQGFESRTTALNNQFDLRYKELSQRMESKSAEIERDLDTKAEKVEQEVRTRSSRQTVRVQTYFMYELGLTLWEFGNIWIETNPQVANEAFNLALRLSDRANDMAKDLTIESDQDLRIGVNSIVMWLCGYLERKDRMKEVYQLAGEIEAWTKGREEDEWEALESCNFVRFKLPRRPEDQANALEIANKLLQRLDIDEVTRLRLRRYYAID